MPKPNQQNGSPGKPRTKVFASLRNHKLVVILLILVLIFPANYAYSYYKDWDNAQMIKGLAQDFPALVSEIESATGLNLEIKADCSITQEKFSEGVKTCAVGAGGNTNMNEKVKSILVKKLTLISEENDTIEYSYRGNNSCLYKYFEETASGSRFYVECITAVNEANIDLAREVFINQ